MQLPGLIRVAPSGWWCGWVCFNCFSFAFVAGLTPPTQAECVAPPDGLVGWWQAEGDANDAAGANHGLALNGVQFAPGEVGQAFVFDGADDRVIISNSAPLNFGPGADFSVEAWIKPEMAVTDFGVMSIVSKRYTPNFIAAVGWEVALVDGRLMAQLADAPLTALDFSSFVAPGADLRDGNYHHVAVIVQRGSSTGGKMMVDGQVVQMFDPTVQPGDLSTSEPLRIGSHADAALNSHFTGAIDEVAVYNRALSEAEVFAIYSAGSAGKCAVPNPPPPAVCASTPPGLVGWWRAESNGADATGAHDGATPYGIAYAGGEVGQAFDFDGSFRRLSIPDNPAFQLTNAMTLEGWVYPRAYGGFITFRGDNRGGLDTWTLDAYQSGFVNFQIDDEANNYQSVRAPLALNQWQHVAATWERASGSMKIYLNGLLIQETNTTLVPIGLLDSGFEPALGIGNHGGTFHQFPFNGLIDELAIYNRALTAAEVQAIHQAGSAGKCTATPPPVITAVSPNVAAPGEMVAITGLNCDPLPQNNIVQFGAVRAAVSAADATRLSVLLPTGATHGPVTVAVNGLIAYSPAAFQPTFAGGGSNLSPATFAPGLTLPSGNGPARVVIADLDGDGKSDLAVANGGDHTISLYRNTSVNGTIDASSFAPRFDLPVVATADSPYKVEAADVDGDGKLDLLAVNRSLNSIAVFRNIATPGTLDAGSFAPRLDYAVGELPLAVAVRDLDGDGRPEIITANYTGASISVLANLGTPGNLTSNSFAPPLPLLAGAGAANLACADFDGDGRPDIAVVNFDETFLTVFRNTTTGGAFGFERLDLPAADSCEAIAVGDLDGDGKTDLIFGASLRGQVTSIARNVSSPGALAFEPRVDFASGGWTHTVALGDLNGDAKPDVAMVSELDSHLSVWENRATPGGFTTASLGSRVDFPSGWNAWGLSLGDLDGDGKPDAVFCNSYDHTITIYRNQMTADNTNCVVSPDNLVGWWQAESNALDAVGGNGGVFAAATYSPSKVGAAFDLDGASNVVVPDAPALNPTNALTIECWVYPRALTTSYGQDLVGKDAEFSGPRQYLLTMGPPPGLDNGTGGFRAHVGVPTGFHFMDGATVVQTATWYHVAMTYDGAALRLFVNGNLDAELAVTGNIITTAEPLRIGGGAPGFDPPYFFNGLLDEVSIFDRALAPSEIQAIYLAGGAGKCLESFQPVAMPDVLSTATNVPVAFNARKLVMNDLDPRGLPLDVAGVSSHSSLGGTVALVAGRIEYTPPSGIGGDDQFIYSITNALGGMATGTVTATVGPGGLLPLNITHGPVVESDEFVVRFAGVPGLTYTIEAASNLDGPWTKAGNFIAPTTDTGFGVGVFEFREPVGAFESRFYRTLYPPY